MTATVDLKMPPAHAPGAGVKEALHSGLYIAKSNTVTIGTDTMPALLFDVPSNTFISEIILEVTTAVEGNTGSDNVLIGLNGGDSDLFMAADTVVSQVGRWSSKRGVAVGGGGYLTSSDEIIEATWTTQSSAGVFDAYIIYKPFADENYIA